MPNYAGACHCGALTLDFASEKSPAELDAQACQCSFCRKHDAVTIAVQDELQVRRYRFGLGITDFLICDVCGTYVAAVSKIEGQPMAVINANVLERRDACPVADPHSYDGENVEVRLARRATKWTPSTMRIEQG